MRRNSFDRLLLTTLATIFIGAQLLGHSTKFPSQAQDAEVRMFTERVSAYATLRAQLEFPWLVLPDGQPSAGLWRRALAAWIQMARADARQGDIFTSGTVAALRARIWGALTEADIEAFIAEVNEGYPPDGIHPSVNQACPSAAAHELPSVLLTVLPPLPEGVEYRVIGADLVLLDVRAELVIDFIFGAFVPLVYV